MGIMNSDDLSLIGRLGSLFDFDLTSYQKQINASVEGASFLVVGGAGTIGQAVTKEIFLRNPGRLHVVDISENNLVELVRDIRSSFGYISGDFKTFCIDVGSDVFTSFAKHYKSYDYVLNLSALKHVRSEKDPFTLMRMIQVNIINSINLIDLFSNNESTKFFTVSTDKAANPHNFMGASKRIMELFLTRYSETRKISMARFANVAFSDGSLLHGFNQRLDKGQPIVAPNDIKRYFVTKKESGELCLMSCLLGNTNEIFFPKLNENIHLMKFSDIAKNFLKSRGLVPYECTSEEEARKLVKELIPEGKWPCLFSTSNTTGEKEIEEFYTSSEKLDMERFKGVGVIKNSLSYDDHKLDDFLEYIHIQRQNGTWTKEALKEQFQLLLPSFAHEEMGMNLDQKM